MMPRERLPNRRPSETVDLWFNGVRHHLTIGYRLDGRPGEAFLHGAKVGSDSDGLHSDIGVLLSRALEHGDELALLASGVARLDGGPWRLQVYPLDVRPRLGAESDIWVNGRGLSCHSRACRGGLGCWWQLGARL